tara:strand:+ start:663 stop:935 length:273 start_codon:yes stop_codon:yes gene_type:complete
MALGPSEIEFFKNRVAELDEKDLKHTYDSLINSLKACKASMETGPTLDQFVEEIVWVDCRLQGYSLTGMRSWWFRTKSRAKYYKIGGLGK